jgi:TP901 family phage tail tape measure protein
VPDSIGTAFVDVAVDPKQISRQLGPLGGGLESAFGKMGSKAGLALAGGIGVAVTGAIAAGKYLYGVGQQFDDMSDTIRVATGKTGKDLDALSKTAKQVGTDVPTSFEDAGKAVASVSTRLGLTGKPLREVSDQVLELSRLTGTDLQTALNSVTRMLGDAGLSGAKASEGIDKLWRAAEATQVPITRLSDLATKFGGPMRQLGFSFDETLAMLGKFEKEGVNTELVMGSMRIALGKFAKAGKDPVKALRETMQAIRDTGDAGKANALAIQAFGARAGPDMAAAIREGRFSIDDLVKTIGKGRDTVMKASEDTRDFAEEWTLFKNRVAVAVAPAAEKMFSAIGEGMERLNKEMPGIIAGLKKQLGPAFAGMGPDLEVIGEAIRDLMPVWKALGQIVLSNMKLVIASIKAFADILAGVIKIVRGILSGDWAQAWEGAKQVVSGFVDYFKAILQSGVLGLLGQLVGPAKALATSVGKAIADGVMAGVSGLVGAVTGVFNSVRSAISAAIGAVSSAATSVGQGISRGVTTAISTLASLVTGVFNAVRSAITGTLSAISSAASAVGRAIVEGVKSGTSTIVSMVSGVFNAVRQAITSAASSAMSAARSVGAAIVSGMKAGLANLASTVTGLVGGAINYIRGLVGQAASAAAAIGSAVVSGIRSGLAGVYGAAKGGLDRLWAAISAVAGAAAGAAVAIGTAIVSGILSGLGGLVSAVGSKIASSVSGAIGWAKGHIGSTADQVTEKEIGIPMVQGMIRAVVMGEQPLSSALAKTVTAAIEAGRKAVADSRAAFESSWGELADNVLKAFDAAQAKIKTSAEKQLAAMELKKQVDDMKAAVASARTELEQAQAEQAALAPQEGESAADFAARAEAAKQRVLAAQKALGDALYEQEHARLERQAEQQRIALDQQIATRRSKLEAGLAAEGKALETGKVNAEKAQKDTIAMLNRYGVSYKTAGAALGKGFATALRESLNAAMDDLETVLRRIRNAIDAVSSANAGVKPKSSVASAVAPASGVARGLLGAPAGLGAPSATTYGAGTVYAPRSPFATMTRELGRTMTQPTEPGPVVVRVYIGDRELTDIVDVQVERSSDALARMLLAGATS